MNLYNKTHIVYCVHYQHTLTIQHFFLLTFYVIDGYWKVVGKD